MRLTLVINMLCEPDNNLYYTDLPHYGLNSVQAHTKTVL